MLPISLGMRPRGEQAFLIGAASKGWEEAGRGLGISHKVQLYTANQTRVPIFIKKVSM